MSILVIGRSGQLASALAHLRQTAGFSAIFLGSNDHDALDVSSTCKIIESGQIRTLINTAAYTKVDQAEAEPDAARRLNTDLPLALAQACKLTHTHFIHISTDYVFDGSKPVGQTYGPDDPTAPINIYGQSKRAGEQGVLECLSTASVVRTSWLMSRFGTNFLRTMASLISSRAALNIVNDQWGTPTIAGDLAHALIYKIAQEPARFSGIEHICGNQICTWFDVAGYVRDALKNTGQRVAQLNPIATSGYPTPARRGRNTALTSSIALPTNLQDAIAKEVSARASEQ